MSSEIFDSPGAASLTPATRGSRAFVEPLLSKAGLPAALADALDDTRWDDEIRAEGDEALILTGRDVGTSSSAASPNCGVCTSPTTRQTDHRSRMPRGPGSSATPWTGAL